MKGLFFLLLLWKPYLPQVNANLYQAEYNEDFYSFVVRIIEIQQKGLAQELFSNLIRINSTDKCTQDLINYRDSINSHEQWAISLLDSSGIFFTGLLSGNTINFGNYEQCLSTSTKNFSSSYCTVEFKISNKPYRRLPWVPHNVPVVFSLCLPDTCSNKQIRTLLEPSTSENNASIKVECRSRRPGFTFGDYFAMCPFIFVWIVIISTTLPKKWIPIKSDVFHQIWDSFSYRRNLATLFKSNTRCTPLSSLHGLRVLSTSIIVWCHIMIMERTENYPDLNKYSNNEFYRSWRGAIVTETHLAVDTFFVITGILITMSCLGKKRKFNLVSYYIHRYLRLTPPYLATLLITSTFANKLYDGPLYTSLFDKNKQNCISYWWTNVLYINNFYPGPNGMASRLAAAIFICQRTRQLFTNMRKYSLYIEALKCMKHSWYLSADWQLFFFISPFVVIVINKWPHHLYKLITAIFLTSIITTFLVSYLYHIPPESWFNKNGELHTDELYRTPYLRAGPWAIGMFYGVILHNFKNNTTKMSKKMQLIAWLLTLLGLSLSFELILPFLRNESDQNGVWSALFNTFLPNIYAASIGWIIFSSETQKAGFIGRILSWTVFQPLAKLTYSAYLIHLLIVQLCLSSQYGYNNVSAATEIISTLGITCLSFAAALLLYLSFEAPIIHLDNIFLQKETPGDRFRKEIGGNNSAPETEQ